MSSLFQSVFSPILSLQNYKWRTVLLVACYCSVGLSSVWTTTIFFVHMEVPAALASSGGYIAFRGSCFSLSILPHSKQESWPARERENLLLQTWWFHTHSFCFCLWLSGEQKARICIFWVISQIYLYLNILLHSSVYYILLLLFLRWALPAQKIQI